MIRSQPHEQPAPSRLPPPLTGPRFSGPMADEPRSDGELARSRRRWGGVLRVLLLGLVVLWGTYIWSPGTVLTALLHVPPTLARPATVLGFWLQWGYHLGHFLTVAGLLLLLLWLLVALLLHGVQRHQRTRQRMQTWAIDLARLPEVDLGRGVDFAAALPDLLRPYGRWWGTEDVLTLGLSNATEANRVQLTVRMPQTQRHQQAAGAALRNLLGGACPQATIRAVPDELATALDGASGWVGSLDLVLERPLPFPLKDLGMFVGGDPLTPLARALQHTPGVTYTALELVLRRVPRSWDWRRSLRTTAGVMQGWRTPDDMSAYDAMLRKLGSEALDTVVRCVVIGDDPTAVHQQLHIMAHGLQTYHQPAGYARQRLRRVGIWWRGGRRVSRVGQTPRRSWGQQLGLVLLGLLLGAGAGLLLPVLLGWLQAWLQPPVWIVQPLPLLPQLFLPLCSLAGLLGGIAALPALRQARARGHQHMLVSHAHRYVFPAPSGWRLPAPGTVRSLLGPWELAALWHAPGLLLEPLMVWQRMRDLPPPAAAFLSATEAAAAEAGTPLPPPQTPQELGQRRLALAGATRPDGTPGLIGPTVRDLRVGMDLLGSAGSGKSTLIEHMVLELLRVGAGGCVLDLKGDLCDRLLRLIPTIYHERVVVLDTASRTTPSLNELSKLATRDKPRDVVAGEMGQILERTDPELWATSLGMQQALRMGLNALLDGEPTPSMLHLTRFYLSKSYQQWVLDRGHDPLVQDFWRLEVPQMDQKVKVSMESLRRRFVGFVNTQIGQRLFCQPESTLHLPDLIRERKLLIVKLVPELLAKENATFLGAALFSAIVSAAFSQQQIADPNARWDWPLIVDEVQEVASANTGNDLERLWTRTRSMGMGLIGAHQYFGQLGEDLGGTVLATVGGLGVLSGVRDDAGAFLDAFAHQGLTVDDLTGIAPRLDVLLRFPVHGADMGLMRATPRKPAAPPVPEPAPLLLGPPIAGILPPGPSCSGADPQEAADWQQLHRLRAAYQEALATTRDADTAALAGAKVWVTEVGGQYTLDALGLPSTVAGDGSSPPPLDGSDGAARQRLHVARQQAADGVLDLIARLRTRVRADALLRLPDQLARCATLDERLRLQSDAHYGGDPLLNTAYVIALATRWPTDLGPPGGGRGKRDGRDGREGRPTPPPTPPQAPPTPPPAGPRPVTPSAPGGGVGATRMVSIGAATPPPATAAAPAMGPATYTDGPMVQTGFPLSPPDGEESGAAGANLGVPRPASAVPKPRHTVAMRQLRPAGAGSTGAADPHAGMHDEGHKPKAAVGRPDAVE